MFRISFRRVGGEILPFYSELKCKKKEKKSHPSAIEKEHVVEN